MLKNSEAELCPTLDSESNISLSTRLWYLPHHYVYNADKDKYRVIFNGASKFCAVSLNECLLRGPDYANTLVGVLIRFREGPMALMAYLKVMFFSSESAGRR